MAGDHPTIGEAEVPPTDGPIPPPTIDAPAEPGPSDADEPGDEGERGEAPPRVDPHAEQFRRALFGGQGKDTDVLLRTFQGVFRPTLLTILGVMLYLRLGWVVGEAGLLGALAIIGAIYGITIPTALSISSVTSNVRLGSGGVFSLIAQSLGLETGGAIGIPLYVAQALSAGLYLYGFTEAWVHIFPSHPPAVVLGAVFLLVAVTVSFNQRLAFRLQGVVLVILVAALTTIALGMPVFQTASVESFQRPEWWGSFESASFWEVFAVFFPAGTGVMVGAGMSGALANPRRSIHRGTLLAVGISMLVYVSVAVWFGLMATPDELRSNYLIVVERAAFGPIVLAGILASTFTAALNSMVTAPRVLQSLASYRILPRAEFFAGNLRNSSLLTSLLVGAVLLLGSLDRVAVLITMFFLLTYLIVNVVVFIEQALGMVSFRPTFRIPLIVPIIGAFGSAMASFIVSPGFAMVAIAMVLAIYAWLVNRELDTPWETVRSSIFVSIVDWAARRVHSGPDQHFERSWKPDLLVPVTNRAQLDGNFRFLRSMTSPKGSLQVVGVARNHRAEVDFLDDLREVTSEFRDDGLYSTATVLESDDLVHGVRQCCSVLGGSQFRPNVLYALVEQHDESVLQGLLDASVDHEIGAAFLRLHPEAGFGHERTINVWVRDQSPNWHLGLRLANLDLAILFAYQIGRNWGAKIRLVTALHDAGEAEMARAYLAQLIEEARLPGQTELLVLEAKFFDALEEAPHADLQIMGLAPTVKREFLDEVSARTGSSVLFVRDSGRESALA